jgi:hypothetical protein
MAGLVGVPARERAGCPVLAISLIEIAATSPAMTKESESN